MTGVDGAEDRIHFFPLLLELNSKRQTEKGNEMGEKRKRAAVVACRIVGLVLCLTNVGLG